MSINDLQDYAVPQTLVRGTPTRIQLGEVQTINDDGTVDVRPVLGRATKVQLQVPRWYRPRLGDRVLYGDLHGDARTPTVIVPFDVPAGSTGSPTIVTPTPSPSWNTPTFAAGWSQYDPSNYPVGLAVDALGWAHVRGRATKTSTPSPPEAICTLPVRPATPVEAAAVCNDQPCAVTVTTAGVVQLRSLPSGVTTPNWVSLHIPPFYPA